MCLYDHRSVVVAASGSGKNVPVSLCNKIMIFLEKWIKEEEKKGQKGVKNVSCDFKCLHFFSMNISFAFN